MTKIMVLPLCFMLQGCAALPSSQWVEDGTGAIVMVEYLYPSCSDVTVSAMRGPGRSLICEFR